MSESSARGSGGDHSIGRATQASPRASQTPQQLQEKGPNDTLVLHSPYGPTRNTTYGWGNLFQPPKSAILNDYPQVHIGVSSLNGVPTIGKADRSMRSLLTQYRKKFNCLEHCYPYHKVSDNATWQSWAEMVKDSNVVDSMDDRTACSEMAADSTDATSLRAHCVNASRFIYTIKANNLLTHVKQLQMQDGEVQEHVQTFFHQRCPLLEPFLGPILVQLPPSFGFSAANLERLRGLYDQLTKEEEELHEISTSPHSATTNGNGSGSASSPRIDVHRRRRRIRIAVEFRNRGWFRQETFDLLRSFRWALVVAHHHDDPTFSSVIDTGAGFLYLRLHGPLGRSVGDYGSLAMKLWAEGIVHYLYPSPNSHNTSNDSSGGDAEQREVFVFSNNSDSHVGGTTSSTVDATCLAEHLRQQLQARRGGVMASVADPTVAPQPAAPSTTAATRAAASHSPVEATAADAGRDAERGAEMVLTDTEVTGSPSDSDVDASPPAKRPRASPRRSSGSGSRRDDEVVID